MNARLALAATMLFGSLVAGLIAGFAPAPETFESSLDNKLEVAMLQCAGGYHTDAQGDCQPDNGLVDSRCGAGFEATPYPNGNDYKCVPIPQGY